MTWLWWFYGVGCLLWLVYSGFREQPGDQRTIAPMAPFWPLAVLMGVMLVACESLVRLGRLLRKRYEGWT